VLCGKGNNGGDGLVVARHLAGIGKSVKVLLTGLESEFAGEAAGMMTRLRSEAPAVQVETLAKETAGRQMDEALDWAELIVDALVGTGFKPPLRAARPS